MPMQSNRPRAGNRVCRSRALIRPREEPLPPTEARSPTRSNVDLTACVIWVSFVQLPGEPICFVGFASLPICQRSFVQSARSNSWIIVKQRDTLKSLASVIEIPALQLDLARQETRFSIHATLWLQRHDLLGNLLGVVRFVRTDLDRAERKQHFRLSCRVCGDLQILGKCILGFGQIF